MAKYRINYSQVKSQARQLKNLSDDLVREINKLKNMQIAVSQSWKGPASNAYQKQISALIIKVNNTKNRMSNVSTTISNVADRIKREDDAAAARAAKLK